MLFEEVYQKFAKESPVTVMARAGLEHALSPDFVNEIFRDTAERQKDSKDLLFSTVVDLMALVVGNVRPTVHAAYKAKKEQIKVAVKSVYNKLEGVEPQVSRALVRRTAGRLQEVIDEIGRPYESPIPGYEVRIIDGNHHPASERRLEVLRDVKAAPLPGQSLVVTDPTTRMAVDVFPCEDGHAQERSILPEVLEDVQPGVVWIADRNFCTSLFLFELDVNDAYFVVREHAANVRVRDDSSREQIGESETGVIFQQDVTLFDGLGTEMRARRTTIELYEPTEEGDTEIHILTNLPKKVSAVTVSGAYRERWTAEGVNAEVKRCFDSELRSLGYPKATLFSFCMALVAYNVTVLLTAAITAAHGKKEAQNQISTYYLSDEIQATWAGMVIALPPQYWEQRFGNQTPQEVAQELLQLAKQVNLSRFRKSKRAPKKPPPERVRYKDTPHVSTSRLLDEKNSAKC